MNYVAKIQFTSGKWRRLSPVFAIKAEAYAYARHHFVNTTTECQDYGVAASAHRATHRYDSLKRKLVTL